jgi:hypothetical protein
MNCTDCREKLVEYIEGLLPESQRQMIEEHLKECTQCQAGLTELKELSARLTSDSKTWQQTTLEDAVFNRIIREQNEKLKQADRIHRQLRIWRRIMKSKITKYAAAAVIIIAVVSGVTIFNKTMPTAYAIEQTIQAYHSVRYLHIKDFKEGVDEPKEFWLEFDEGGNVKNVRANLPEWMSPSDGAKVTIWQQGKATVWLKKKNTLFTTMDKRVARQVLKMAQEYDPKLAVERLREREKRGWVKIETDKPSNKAEPIIITVTYLPESPTPDRHFVLTIDQATKLVIAIETYQLKENEYQYLGVIEFYDYNQQVDPDLFIFDNLPEDIMRIDQTTQEIGLAQGNLSNEEIAVRVARQFFKALIAKDYDKAGKLYEGIPGKGLENAFGNVKILRIISVGPAEPHPNPRTKGLVVPCVVEVEKEGKITEWKLDKLGVRQVYNQRGRWTIFGGI